MGKDRELHAPVGDYSAEGTTIHSRDGSEAQELVNRGSPGDAQQSPLWRIAWSLMPVLPLLTLSVAGAVIFLASLPLFASTKWFPVLPLHSLRLSPSSEGCCEDVVYEL